MSSPVGTSRMILHVFLLLTLVAAVAAVVSGCRCRGLVVIMVGRLQSASSSSSWVMVGAAKVMAGFVFTRHRPLFVIMPLQSVARNLPTMRQLCFIFCQSCGTAFARTGAKKLGICHG